jgi:hypothetical protein
MPTYQSILLELIMKSSIRFSAIATAVAFSAVAASTAFAATYVPHENNFGLYDATTRGNIAATASPTDSRMTKNSDAMQPASTKKVAMTDNSRSIRREDGSAK